MKRRTSAFWGFLVLVLIGAHSPFAQALTSSEAIKEIKEIQGRVRKKLDETDKALIENIKKSKTIKMRDLIRSDNDYAFKSIEEQVEKLRERRAEYLLREQFLNELTNKFTTGFSGGNAKEFLENQLLEMSVTAVGVGSPDSNTDSKYWQFLMYASVAIREIPEQIENAFKFLETYMDFSTLSKPRAPSEFKSQRNYFNSRKTESGKPGSRDDWEGEDVEKSEGSKSAEKPAAPTPTPAAPAGPGAKPSPKTKP